MPTGYSLIPSAPIGQPEDGSYLIIDNGQTTIGGISAPHAYDALGNPVPANAHVENNTFIVELDYTSVTYPVTYGIQLYSDTEFKKYFYSGGWESYVAPWNYTLALTPREWRTEFLDETAKALRWSAVYNSSFRQETHYWVNETGIYNQFYWGIILVTSLLVIQIYKFPAIAFYRRPISISLNELSKADLTQTSAIYYIGRDDCPACREFYPSLMELSTKYQKKIYYYNTQQDRNDNSTSLRYVLQKYEIDEVPVILIFDGNGGIQKISSQNILENFSNYLEATLKT